MTPSPSSAEGGSGDRADHAFLERRRRQLREPSRRRAVAVVAAMLALMAVVGANVGPEPTYGRIDRLVDYWTSRDSISGERGGSLCVGWPATLTISARPTEIPPDKALVFLSLNGWHLYLGSNLAKQGARVEVSAVDGDLRILDGATDAEVDPSGKATLRTTPPETRDEPALSTNCQVSSLTVNVVDAEGRPLPADTIVLANGTSPGTNPFTFERATS